MKLATRTGPAPGVTPESEHYWRSAAKGEMLIRRCNECGEPHFFPRALCPFCLGETRWEAVSGGGEVYSYSIMRRAEHPYAIAYVRLDEGPVVMTNVIDCDSEELQIGARVKLVFTPSEGEHPLPMFTLERGR